MIEGGFVYGQQRRVGDVIHWQCERRGECKARVHTMDMQFVKRTNEHLHEPDEQAVTCQDVKNCVKRKASETQDSSHFIVGDSLLAVSEGVSVKLSVLFNVRGSEFLLHRHNLLPWKSLSFRQNTCRRKRERTSFSMTLALDQRESSSSGRSETLICWYYLSTGSLMGPSKLHLIFLARST